MGAIGMFELILYVCLNKDVSSCEAQDYRRIPAPVPLFSSLSDCEEQKRRLLVGHEPGSIPLATREDVVPTCEEPIKEIDHG